MSLLGRTKFVFEIIIVFINASLFFKLYTYLSSEYFSSKIVERINLGIAVKQTSQLSNFAAIAESPVQSLQAEHFV